MCQAQAGVRGVGWVAAGPRLQQVAPQEPGDEVPSRCHAACAAILTLWRGEFYLGLPSRGSVRERLCHWSNALSSESTVPKCHLSGCVWICKTCLSPGQLFISREQEDIPRSESSLPCPACSSFQSLSGEIQEETVLSESLMQAIHSEKTTTSPAHALPSPPRSSSSLLAPWSLSEVSFLHRLAKQLVLIHLSPC